MSISFSRKSLVLACLTGLIGFGSLASAETNTGKTYTFAWKNHSEPNQTYTMGGENDRIYVVETYFNGCPYCHQNAPLVQALVEEQAANTQVSIVDLSRDTRQSDFQSWINKHQPKHPVLQNGINENNFLGNYGVRAYPTTLILDCNLNVALRTEGAWNAATMNKIRQKIEAMRSTSCVVQ